MYHPDQIYAYVIASFLLIAISKAYKLLQDEDETKKILQVIDDGKALANKKVRIYIELISM